MAMDMTKEENESLLLLLRLASQNEEWNEAASPKGILKLRKGAILNAKRQMFYLIKSGIVKTVHPTPEGSEWTLLYQEAGCLLNEIGVLVGGLENFYYRCETDAELYTFDGSLLSCECFIRNNPSKVKNLIMTLARKDAIAYAYTSDLAYADAKGRVCQALMSLIYEHDWKISFSPEITQTDIAAMMGLHPVTVMRVIKELRHSGIIGKFNKKKIEILDKNALSQLAYGTL